jgi:DNA mismatch endonuclease (patch repair protein)
MGAATPAQLSGRMRRIRNVDTKPELVVGGIAHAMGYRFRLHRRDLPGTPDLVFTSRKKAVLVHGCFWHQHNCELGRKQPSTNQRYWLPKLIRNVDRDAVVNEELARVGWSILIIWECETRDPLFVRRSLHRFLA